MNESNTNNQNETQNSANPVNSQNPYLLSKDLFGDMVYTMSKDMKFLGIVAIIYGILNCLTIIGAIVGVPYIFAGLRLKESAESFEFFSKNNDEVALQQAIERQKRFFYIIKILTIIGIVLAVLFIAIYIIIIILLLSSGDGFNEIFNEFQ